MMPRGSRCSPQRLECTLCALTASEAFTFTALMSACRSGSQWAKALALFDELDAQLVDSGLLGAAVSCALADILGGKEDCKVTL